VLQSSTALAFAVPRIFMDDTAEDHKAIQSVLNQIEFYQLSRFDGQMKTRDWSKLPIFPAPKPSGKGETGWVKPETFFDQLPTVMKQVPPLPGEEALYQWIGSVLDAAVKDAAVKKTLTETAIAAERELITPFFLWRSRRPDADEVVVTFSNRVRDAYLSGRAAKLGVETSRPQAGKDA
jgi:hypothetical protein